MKWKYRRQAAAVCGILVVASAALVIGLNRPETASAGYCLWG